MDSAPSVGTSRPWRVLGIKDTGLRDGVRANFARCNATAASGYDGSDRDAYLSLKLAGLDRAPEHLAIFNETAAVEGQGLRRQTMPQSLIQNYPSIFMVLREDV